MFNSERDRRDLVNIPNTLHFFFDASFLCKSNLGFFLLWTSAIYFLFIFLLADMSGSDQECEPSPFCI